MKSPYTILALCLCGCREVGCWHVYHRNKITARKQFNKEQDPEWPLRILTIQDGILNTVNHFSEKEEHSARTKGTNVGRRDAYQYDHAKPGEFQDELNPYDGDSQSWLHELWAASYKNAFEGNKRRK